MDRNAIIKRLHQLLDNAVVLMGLGDQRTREKWITRMIRCGVDDQPMLECVESFLPLEMSQVKAEYRSGALYNMVLGADVTDDLLEASLVRIYEGWKTRIARGRSNQGMPIPEYQEGGDYDEADRKRFDDLRMAMQLAAIVRYDKHSKAQVQRENPGLTDERWFYLLGLTDYGRDEEESELWLTEHKAGVAPEKRTPCRLDDPKEFSDHNPFAPANRAAKYQSSTSVIDDIPLDL